jgi:archaellum component FlaC
MPTRSTQNSGLEAELKELNDQFKDLRYDVERTARDIPVSFRWVVFWLIVVAAGVGGGAYLTYVVRGRVAALEGKVVSVDGRIAAIETNHSNRAASNDGQESNGDVASVADKLESLAAEIRNAGAEATSAKDSVTRLSQELADVAAALKGHGALVTSQSAAITNITEKVSAVNDQVVAMRNVLADENGVTEVARPIIPDPEGEETASASESSPQESGEVRIENRTSSTQTVIVNGRSYPVYPGTNVIQHQVEDVSLQLDGEEKTWNRAQGDWALEDGTYRLAFKID